MLLDVIEMATGDPVRYTRVISIGYADPPVCGKDDTCIQSEYVMPQTWVAADVTWVIDDVDPVF
jgi:hypothetical protein